MKERLLRNRDGQTLEEFLAAYHPKDYPHPSVTVDLVVVSLEGRRPELLMVRRGNHPCLDCWALPGGFVEQDEFTEDAAARELEEETHVRGLALTEIGLFSGPDRDPRGWTMSCAYAAVAERSKLSVCGDDDAAEAGWFRLEYRLSGNTMKLKLTREDEVLTAEIQVTLRHGVFGTEYHIGAFETDGIAFDHCKMIAQTILKLRTAGRLS